MRLFKQYRLLYAIVMAVAFFNPSQVPMASTGVLNAGYSAYPLPSAKPMQCNETRNVNHDNISEKQAAAAALGLYLGYRNATAPIIEHKNTRLSCL